MARIRTIKPEFPQSESMGRVSRDARLLFIQLWTICDDAGRARGNSRMLASLLFPYDDDAKDLIDGWLDELESEGCLVRYKVDSDSYIEIRKWLIHQKIDKPSQSKIPSFDESSRILANPRESSSLDQGPRTKDQGEEEAQAPTLGKAERVSRTMTLSTFLAECKEAGVKPIPDDHFIRSYCRDAGIGADMLALAWQRFKEEHTTGTRKSKRYSDWPATFANSVKDRWYRLWTIPLEGDAIWTSEGLQARKVIDARLNREQAHEHA